MNELPLQGVTVLEFSQYLSGPSAGLRLADFGARVIKIERPGSGEAGRKLPIKNLWADDSSLLFHTINRNKESFSADLKNHGDLEMVKQLITKSDVLIHNFRPGVMEKIGLGYDDVKKINNKLVYAALSGYGNTGPWKNKPGQDLLLQSMTGLAFTTGNGSNGPVPFGIAVGDILSGAQLVQGIIAALIRRHKTGEGALIELSLMESLLDFQFELLTTYFASGKQPVRSFSNNAHPLLSAPYGIYKTSDGYIALAMMDIHELADAIDCLGVKVFQPVDVFAKRDEIKEVLAAHFIANTSGYWIEKLHACDLWAMPVLDWEQMMNTSAYQSLQMEQHFEINGKEYFTTRCPVRIDGKRLTSARSATAPGAANEKIISDFRLEKMEG